MRTTGNLSAIALVALVSLSASIVRAADAKDKDKAADDSLSVGETRTQKFKSFAYFHGSIKVSLLTFPFKMAALIPDLQKAMESAHVKPTGPMMLIYRGALDDSTAEYDIELGFPVPEKTAGDKEFKVRQVPAYDCMSVIYSGPLGGIMDAYEKLIPAAEDATGKEAGETRLMFLYVEGVASPNNVIHVSVGPKP